MSLFERAILDCLRECIVGNRTSLGGQMVNASVGLDAPFMGLYRSGAAA
jgi:hypothetical protein